MAVAFTRGQALGPNDLHINLRNSQNQFTTAYRVVYSLFDYTTGNEILLTGYNGRPAAMSSIGHYYANAVIPDSANLGTYRIRWTFQETISSPAVQAVEEFAVIDANLPQNELISLTRTVPTDDNTRIMVRKVRFLLRDNNPDRNYHFSPPNSERSIQNFTQVVGFCWTDEELCEYIDMAIDEVNDSAPYEFVPNVVQMPPHWRTLVVIGAVKYALTALTANWVHEEFSTISGSYLNLILKDGEEVSITIGELYDLIREENDKTSITSIGELLSELENA